MHYQNFVANYTIWEGERKGIIVYLNVGSAIDDAEPSDIMEVFLLPLL
jgi:hypothetical protein